MKCRLRSERGSVVIDAALGVMVVGITVVAFATSIGAAGRTSQYSRTSVTVSSLLNSTVNDLATDPLAVPTVRTTTPVTFGAEDIPVTVWQDSSDRWVTIHAATPLFRGGDCQSSLASCATASISVVVSDVGIDPTPLVGSWSSVGSTTTTGSDVAPGPVGVAEVPVGSGEVRYVVRVAAESAGELTFDDGPATLLNVPIPAETDQYFYGSINPDGATQLTITVRGATMHLSHLFLYQAPTP